MPGSIGSKHNIKCIGNTNTSPPTTTHAQQVVIRTSIRIKVRDAFNRVTNDGCYEWWFFWGFQDGIFSFQHDSIIITFIEEGRSSLDSEQLLNWVNHIILSIH